MSPAPSNARLLALVVLVLVLSASYACYSTVRDLRARLLGPGLQHAGDRSTP